VGREFDVGIVGEDDSMCTPLQGGLEQGDELCGFGNQSVGDLFVELDQVANVNIAVVFFEERILAQLVSVDEYVVESEVENEGLEQISHSEFRIPSIFAERILVQAAGEDGLAVHLAEEKKKKTKRECLGIYWRELQKKNQIWRSGQEEVRVEFGAMIDTGGCDSGLVEG